MKTNLAYAFLTDFTLLQIMEQKEIRLTLTEEVLQYLQRALALAAQLPDLGLSMAPVSETTLRLWNLRNSGADDSREEQLDLTPSHSASAGSSLTTLRRPHPFGDNFPAVPAVIKEKLESKGLTDESSATSASSTVPKTTVPGNFEASLKQEWMFLEEQARKCRRERQAAEKAEEEVNAQVARFFQTHGARGRALAGDFAIKIEDAIALSQRKSQLVAQWQEEKAKRREKEAKEREIREELQKKRKEMEALQDQLRDLNMPRSTQRERPRSREQQRSKSTYRNPGFYASEGAQLQQPCDKWAGPRKDLRGKRFCKTCNLTGVPRSSDCPNYFHHIWWTDKKEPQYSYSETELHKKLQEEADSTNK